MCPSLMSAKHTSFKGLNQIVDLSNSHQYQNIDPNTKKIEELEMKTKKSKWFYVRLEV